MEDRFVDDSEKPKPFKLCFVENKVRGRSNIQINRPLSIPSVVTPKFYVKQEAECEEFLENVRKNFKELEVLGPREKYQRPLTENQRYGWYQISLTDMDRSDRRLNHAKNTNPIIKEHLMNYAKIRN